MYERKSRISDNKVAYYSILIAFMFLAFIGSIFIGSELLFFIKIPINAANFIIFPIIAMIIGKFLLSRDREQMSWKFMILTLIGFFVLVAILAFINNLIWDSSYDSLAYHQEMVIDLYKGWNPIYQSNIKDMNLWVAHYTKAPGVFAACLYKLTTRIEAAKVLTMLLPITLGILSFGVFNLVTKGKKILSLFVAIIMVLNPVIIGQTFSYYVDSALAIYIIILLMTLYLIFFYEDIHLFKYFILVNVATFMINIKFTGLAYAGAILFGFLIMNLIYKRKEHNIKLFVFLICGLVFSVIILGFNPYVTNTIHNGNPLYPLVGKGKINIMTNNTPLDFRYDSEFKQAYKSMVAMPNPKNFNGKKAQNFSELLGVNKNTLKYYSTTDARVRGFGPYSIIFIPLSFIGVIYLLATCRDRKKLIASILALVLVGAVAIVGGVLWWARYIGFLWAIPLMVGLLLFLRKSKISKTIGMAFLLIMFVNSAMILPAAVYYKNQRSNTIKEYVFTKPLIIYQNNFEASYINKAREFHLDYTIGK
ncbi:MAG: hypothetical protein ACRDD2_12385 [Sarcina sp.]